MAFQNSGQLNLTLGLILGRSIEISWLSDPTLALFGIMIADIWQWTPFMFLVLFSGLLALPPDPINSARILGGSRWKIFRDVELPLLKPVIVIALLLRAIEAFKMFDTVFIITKGGPGYATQTLSVYLYEEGFKFLRMAYVTAEGLTIMILIAVVSWFAVKPILRRVV
jgi:multiple sugar transport system permease protein